MAALSQCKTNGKYKTVLKCVTLCLHDCLIFPNQLYNTFPRILQYLPGSHQTLFSNWRKLKLFISDIIKNHRRDWDPDEPRDFIDAFLKEMAKVGKMLAVLSSVCGRSISLMISDWSYNVFPYWFDMAQMCSLTALYHPCTPVLQASFVEIVRTQFWFYRTQILFAMSSCLVFNVRTAASISPWSLLPYLYLISLIMNLELPLIRIFQDNLCFWKLLTLTSFIMDYYLICTGINRWTSEDNYLAHYRKIKW